MAKRSSGGSKSKRSDAQVQAMYQSLMSDRDKPKDDLPLRELPTVDYQSAFRRRSVAEIQPGDSYLMLPSQVIGAFDPVRILDVTPESLLQVDPLPARCKKPFSLGEASSLDGGRTLHLRLKVPQALVFEAAPGTDLAAQYDEIASRRALRPLEEATLRDMGLDAEGLLALDQDDTRCGVAWQAARTARVQEVLAQVEEMRTKEPWARALADWTFLEEPSLDLNRQGLPTICAIPGEPRENRTLLAYPADWAQPSKAIASWLVRRAYLQTRLEPGGDIAQQCARLSSTLAAVMSAKHVDRMFVGDALDEIRKDWDMAKYLQDKPALSQLPQSLPDAVFERDPDSGAVSMKVDFTRHTLPLDATGAISDVFADPESEEQIKRMAGLGLHHRTQDSTTKFIQMLAHQAIRHGAVVEVRGHAPREFVHSEDCFTIRLRDRIDPTRCLSTLEIEVPAAKVLVDAHHRMVRFRGSDMLDVASTVAASLRAGMLSSDADPASQVVANQDLKQDFAGLSA